MCGLTGFIDYRRRAGQEELERIAANMAATLTHRGPDEGGVWAEAEAGIAFGFRRLAIVDLSTAGRQPMISANGRYAIVYNGEIYNADEIRSDLMSRGMRFRSRTDTEVILEACSLWGIDAAIHRLVGMFAIAIWDRRERILTLVRDRIGEKPLYYGRFDRIFYFGSQPKSFVAHPAWRPEVDPASLALYLRYSHVPSPRSIYRGLAQLEPGCIATITADEIRQERYWSAEAMGRRCAAGRAQVDEPTAIDQVERLLRDSVRRRMIADVPVGAFLSGGIDSSTVVALMQAESAKPVKTFSIGFHSGDFDEAPNARAVARHLGTDHRELYVDGQDALDAIPALPDWYDEPFADSSQIPILLVAKLARSEVSVCLSGDGGDELFAGYPRYQQAQKRLDALPPLSFATIRGSGGMDRHADVRTPGADPTEVAGGRHDLEALGRRIEGDRLYRDLLSHWPDPSAIMDAGTEPMDPVFGGDLALGVPDFLDRMQLIDILRYLPTDILTKLDRASMAVGLEARAPFLDHRLVEFVWRLPQTFKRRGAATKWILRQILRRHAPQELIERPKMGLMVPLDSWLRHGLREWAEELMSEKALSSGGLLRVAPIRKCWSEYLAGATKWRSRIWIVLMFQSWKLRWLAA